MNGMRRRDTFLAPLAAAFPAMAADTASGDPQSVRIFASGDGISRTPAEYSALLTKLTADDRVEPDNYSLGGIVEKLEKRMAQVLGKEAAVWLPTGTLANQLAIRLLCGTRHRARGTAAASAQTKPVDGERDSGHTRETDRRHDALACMTYFTTSPSSAILDRYLTCRLA